MVAAGRRKGGVQLAGEFEIVGIGRGIPGDVAAVDDEIGPRRVDVFAHPVKIIGEASDGGG